MVACGAVTGGIIAAGGIVGHKIGHGIEERGGRSATDTAAQWVAPLRLPTMKLQVQRARQGADSFSAGPVWHWMSGGLAACSPHAGESKMARRDIADISAH